MSFQTLLLQNYQIWYFTMPIIQWCTVKMQYRTLQDYPYDPQWYHRQNALYRPIAEASRLVSMDPIKNIGVCCNIAKLFSYQISLKCMEWYHWLTVVDKCYIQQAKAQYREGNIVFVKYIQILDTRIHDLSSWDHWVLSLVKLSSSIDVNWRCCRGSTKWWPRCMARCI